MTHVSRAWIRGGGGLLVLDRMTACDILLCLEEVIMFEYKITCQTSLKLILDSHSLPLIGETNRCPCVCQFTQLIKAKATC